MEQRVQDVSQEEARTHLQKLNEGWQTYNAILDGNVTFKERGERVEALYQSYRQYQDAGAWFDRWYPGWFSSFLYDKETKMYAFPEKLSSDAVPQ